MKKRLAPIVLGLFFSASLQASENTPPLTIEMANPNVRITIPGMPAVDMGVHPMNENNPVFRLRGSTDTTSVSVITPKIDAPVTPMNCAIAVANVVLAGTSATREQMFLGRSDEQTFLVIYGLPLEQSVLLNTHIVSANDTTQCIEAHVTKISISDADIEPWFNGFGASKIENF